MDPLIPYQREAIHLFLSCLRTDICRAEPMNLSMFSHEFLATLVVCTLVGWGTSFSEVLGSIPGQPS